jgi:hypothetical protein
MVDHDKQREHAAKGIECGDAFPAGLLPEIHHHVGDARLISVRASSIPGVSWRGHAVIAG